ncbi:MAG: hypothetical protein K4571_10240 [Deltaproteobacteria bacterium]
MPAPMQKWLIALNRQCIEQLPIRSVNLLHKGRSLLCSPFSLQVLKDNRGKDKSAPPIDKLVYELYELTPKEIAIVEKQ